MTNPLVPNPGDVVLVTFGFLDHSGEKLRPAVVVSKRIYNEHWSRFVFTPITGSSGSIEGGIEIRDLAGSGLNRRSYCQGILSTTENNSIQRIIGQLSARDMDNIRKLMHETLAI